MFFSRGRVVDVLVRSSRFRRRRKMRVGGIVIRNVIVGDGSLVRMMWDLLLLLRLRLLRLCLGAVAWRRARRRGWEEFRLLCRDRRLLVVACAHFRGGMMDLTVVGVVMLLREEQMVKWAGCFLSAGSLLSELRRCLGSDWKRD